MRVPVPIAIACPFIWVRLVIVVTVPTVVTVASVCAAAMLTAPMVFVPAGSAAEIVTAPVLQAVTLPFRVERVASVE